MITLIVDLTSSERHEVATDTPCLVRTHDGCSTTPTGYTQAEAEALGEDPIPLSAHSVTSLPFVWDDVTETYWASRIVRMGG